MEIVHYLNISMMLKLQSLGIIDASLLQQKYILGQKYKIGEEQREFRPLT